MSHRVRSRTIDSAETKKAKTAAPRRLQEKIAIIKKREHEQSAEFEQAMQSIFEMQQARIHSGGGSMPSLQAIDNNTPPAPTIDMQSIFRDFDEMKRGSGSTIIDHTPPLRAPIARHTSMETEPYMQMGLNSSDHYWNASPEWLEGDLSRHKSDSDLQQSLMMQPQTSPQHISPSQQIHRPHKGNPPGDLSLWNAKKRPSSATTHALLSPDHYISTPEGLTPAPMGGAMGTTSSLPDLTTIEFSSGLDIPLESDEPVQDKQFSNSFQQPIVPMLTPTPRTPGPSNLIYNSFQAPNVAQHTGYNTTFQYPSNSDTGYTHQTQNYQQQSPVAGISKSPTMPEFRNMHSSNGFVAKFPPTSRYKPILPSMPNNQSYQRFPTGLSGFLPQVGVLQGHAPSQPRPQMTIIIQPPPSTAANSQQSTTTYQQSSPLLREPPNHGGLPASFNVPPGSEGVNSDKSISTANQFLNGVSPQRPNNAIPTSYGLYLPSYTEAKKQQSLQQKFASINVGRNEAMIRSHSEENLQKAQKEKPDVIQQNPFMGTLANANSVPCVYVDPVNADQQYERSDSPSLDSPSTSASYASSPPSVRPYWLEDDYVFREWPLDSPAGGTNRPGSPLAHHRSLSDLSTIPEITELVSSNRSHQLSLPSVAMTDLTVDEQLEKGPSDYYLNNDFDMEEAVMDTLLKNEVPELHPYDISVLGVNVGESLLSSSPESFLRTDFH